MSSQKVWNKLALLFFMFCYEALSEKRLECTDAVLMLWPSTDAIMISYKLNPSYRPAAEIDLLTSAACVMQEVRGDSHDGPCSP